MGSGLWKHCTWWHLFPRCIHVRCGCSFVTFASSRSLSAALARALRSHMVTEPAAPSAAWQLPGKWSEDAVDETGNKLSKRCSPLGRRSVINSSSTNMCSSHESPLSCMW